MCAFLCSTTVQQVLTVFTLFLRVLCFSLVNNVCFIFFCQLIKKFCVLFWDFCTRTKSNRSIGIELGNQSKYWHSHSFPCMSSNSARLLQMHIAELFKSEWERENYKRLNENINTSKIRSRRFKVILIRQSRVHFKCILKHCSGSFDGFGVVHSLRLCLIIVPSNALDGIDLNGHCAVMKHR